MAKTTSWWPKDRDFNMINWYYLHNVHWSSTSFKPPVNKKQLRPVRMWAKTLWGQLVMKQVLLDHLVGVVSVKVSNKDGCFYGLIWFLRGPISWHGINHFLFTSSVSEVNVVIDPCRTVGQESHAGAIASTRWSPTLVFWIWRLPCSCRENRGSFPSRLTPFFLQVTEGSGSPDAWHLNRATPPTACVWLDGPCLMMGGGRSFRAEDEKESLHFFLNALV